MNARQRRQHRRAVNDLMGRHVRFIVPGMEWRPGYPMRAGVAWRMATRDWMPYTESRYVLGVWEAAEDCMWWIPLRNLRAMSREIAEPALRHKRA